MLRFRRRLLVIRHETFYALLQQKTPLDTSFHLPANIIMKFILASTSPYRKQLLEKVGLTFQAAAPDVDEATFQQKICDPRELAATLAQEKALAVQASFAKAASSPMAGSSPSEPQVFIGSDQVVSLGTKIYGKAGTPELATQQLRELSGKTHQILTALCVVRGSSVWGHLNVSEMFMRPLSDAQIARYIERDSPLDCAGSYKIEKSGISLFSKIICEDFTAIQGLPMIALYNHLIELGAKLP